MKFHDYFYTGYEATFFIAEGGEREKTPYPNPLFTKKKKKKNDIVMRSWSISQLFIPRNSQYLFPK